MTTKERKLKNFTHKFKNKDCVIFDAVRDNKGKGLKAICLVKILKKVDEKNL